MSNAAEKLSFKARGFLNRTLEYRSHLKGVYYGLLGLSAGLFCGLTGFALFQAGAGQPETAGTAAFWGILLSFFFWAEARFLIKPVAFSRVHLRSGGMTLERMGEMLEIPFSSVERVHFSHLPMAGGFFRIELSNGRSFYFTVVLERSEYILEAIASSRPDLVDEKTLLNYRRTAIVIDHSWSRVYGHFKRWPFLIFKYAVTPAAFWALLWSTSLIPPEAAARLLPAVLGMCALLGLSKWFATDLILAAQTRKRLIASPELVRRDVQTERKIQRGAEVLYWILLSCLFAGLLMWKFSY